MVFFLRLNYEILMQALILIKLYIGITIKYGDLVVSLLLGIENKKQRRIIKWKEMIWHSQSICLTSFTLQCSLHLMSRLWLERCWLERWKLWRWKDVLACIGLIFMKHRHSHIWFHFWCAKHKQILPAVLNYKIWWCRFLIFTKLWSACFTVWKICLNYMTALMPTH